MKIETTKSGRFALRGVEIIAFRREEILDLPAAEAEEMIAGGWARAVTTTKTASDPEPPASTDDESQPDAGDDDAPKRRGRHRKAD